MLVIPIFVDDPAYMAMEYLSTGEAALILGVSRVAVTLMVQQDKLPAIRVGRSWAVPKDTLLEFARTYRKGAGGRKPKAVTGGEA